MNSYDMAFSNGLDIDEYNKYIKNLNSQMEEQKAIQEKFNSQPVQSIAYPKTRMMYRMEISATAEEWIKILTILKEAEDAQD